MRGKHVVFFVILSLFCLTSTAWADEGDEQAPYAPELFPVDQLIVTEQFRSAPLTFPWEEISSERVASHGRRDFSTLYNVDFDTVRQRLREAYSNSEDLIALSPQALPYLHVEQVRISGIEIGDDRGRITVGHPDMEPMLTVDVEREGQRTRFTTQNLMRTRQFSGFMPARIGFRPIGASIVSFRYN